MDNDKLLQKLFEDYIDNVVAHTSHEQPLRFVFHPDGSRTEPDETLMRAVEEASDIPEQMADEFRRDLMVRLAHIRAHDIWTASPRVATVIYRAGVCSTVTLDGLESNPTIAALAATCQEDNSVLPILADALEDAGCHNAQILEHLRMTHPIFHTHCPIVMKLMEGD